MRSGFTIVEILVALVVISAVAFLALQPFTNFREGQALDNATSDIISLINEARNSTLSSKNDDSYGVRVEEFQLILFKGETFDGQNGIEEIYELDQLVHVSDISIAGGSDIVFQRLTGDTYNQGTLTVSPRNESASSTRVISIEQVGIIERQVVE